MGRLGSLTSTKKNNFGPILRATFEGSLFMFSGEFFFNFLPQNRLILKFLNLSVLHKGLLMQDWVF